MTTWYRYEERRYAPPVDEFDNICGTGSVAIVCMAFWVRKETAKGVRLSNGRFVLRDARKRYACPTREEAQASFLARKRKQLRILNAQVSHVSLMIKLAETKLSDRVEVSQVMELY